MTVLDRCLWQSFKVVFVIVCLLLSFGVIAAAAGFYSLFAVVFLGVTLKTGLAISSSAIAALALAVSLAAATWHHHVHHAR